MVYYDQLHRAVSIPAKPRRIISLVPSQTELLYSLGLEQEVVGITKFCVHPPEWFKEKARVGGTKKLDMERIRSLQPDLIIGNKAQNDRGQLEELMQQYPVWVSEVNHLSEALDMICALGDITAAGERARVMANEIEARFSMLSHEVPGIFKDRPRPVAAYFIWRDPWMAAGKNTFIDAMLKSCGLDNCFSDALRYPEISLDQLRENSCNLIMLSSEPFPFKEKHAAEIRRQLPGIKIVFVDGEMFSWYGSRLLKAPDYFKKIVKQLG